MYIQVRAISLILFLPCVLSSSSRVDSCAKGDYEYYSRRANGIDEFPFIAYMTMYNNWKPHIIPYAASGTIIARNVIMTRAYHCEVSPSSSFKVRAGYSYVLQPNMVDHRVAEYAVHPKRNRKTHDERGLASGYTFLYSFDFCLLRLKELLPLTPGFQLSALPHFMEPLITTHTFITTGWGPMNKTNFIQGLNHDLVSDDKVSLFYQEHVLYKASDCQKFFTARLQPDQFCLSCSCRDRKTAWGDDGGPVIDAATWKVVGIVVNGDGSDPDNVLSLYSMTSHAVDWIVGISQRWSNLQGLNTFKPWGHGVLPWE